MSRIPADESVAFTNWHMPEVRDGQIIQVEKLQQRGPRGELVNLEKDTVIYNSMTAGQLEEISNQAYEEVREQAYQDGLKQGHDEGYQAGLEAASHTLKQQAESLQQTIDQLYHYLGGQDDEVEQALVNVATCVASAVLRRELSLDSSHIRAVIHEAIAILPMDASNINIFLNEADYSLLAQQADIPDSWQLQSDTALSAGGCRVTSRHSVVDYTLEEQFQQTINSLVEQRFAVLAQQAKQRVEQQLPDEPEAESDSNSESESEG